MARPHWSSQVKIVIGLLLLAFSIFLLVRYKVLIKPFILAVLLAYALSPLVDALQTRLKIRRGWAALLTYLIMILVVAAIPLLVIPSLMDETAGLNFNLQQIITQGEVLLGKQILIAGRVIDLSSLIQQVSGTIQSIVQPFFSRTLAIIFEIISSLVWIIFILVISFNLVKDGPQLKLWLENLVPPDYRSDFQYLWTEISRVWAAFFRGQLSLAVSVAIIFTIAGLILGLPFSLAMGALAGLLEFLPSIGHTIWLITAGLLALFVGSTWIPLPHWVFMLIIVGFELAFQQFDINYLIPRIVGRRINLPPLVIILGILMGALTAGVLGILLAAPTIASARVIGRYLYANLLDRELASSS